MILSMMSARRKPFHLAHAALKCVDYRIVSNTVANQFWSSHILLLLNNNGFRSKNCLGSISIIEVSIHQKRFCSDRKLRYELDRVGATVSYEMMKLCTESFTGHHEAVAVGNWRYWVSRGHLCLYILNEQSGDQDRCYQCLTRRLWEIELLSSS